VLIPAVPDDSDIEPLYSEIYDPLWAVCEEEGLVVNSHSGSGHPDYDHLMRELDETVGFHMMVANKAPWDMIAGDAPQYDGAPPG